MKDPDSPTWPALLLVACILGFVIYVAIDALEPEPQPAPYYNIETLP